MNRKGFNLVALTVALAIAGGLLVTFGAFLRHSLRAEGSIRKKNEIIDLQRYVRVARNCQRTIAALSTATIPPPAPSGTPGPTTSALPAVPSNCANTAPIPGPMALKRADGQDLIKIPTRSSYSEIGGYQLRAFCTNIPKVYLVEYKSPEEGSWKNLFPNPPFTCP